LDLGVPSDASAALPLDDISTCRGDNIRDEREVDRCELGAEVETRVLFSRERGLKLSLGMLGALDLGRDTLRYIEFLDEGDRWLSIEEF